MNSAFFKTTL